jgi:nucleotide-binding universal stress UspA family protein
MAASSSAESKPFVVVVGVDFSSASELALVRALELAAAQPRSEVHLVNVVQTYGPQVAYEMPGDSSAISVLTTAEAAARFKEYVDQALASFSAKHPGKSYGRAFTHLRYDSIADQIAQLAADLEADLIVVGTHGRRGVSRLLLGSTAEATVRLAPCPVLVMRPKALPDVLPRIEPPCPRCVEARRASGGSEMWCEQHRERHGQRHTYHQGDRSSADREMPLFLRP